MRGSWVSVLDDTRYCRHIKADFNGNRPQWNGAGTACGGCGGLHHDDLLLGALEIRGVSTFGCTFNSTLQGPNCPVTVERNSWRCPGQRGHRIRRFSIFRCAGPLKRALKNQTYAEKRKGPSHPHAMMAQCIPIKLRSVFLYAAAADWRSATLAATSYSATVSPAPPLIARNQKRYR